MKPETVESQSHFVSKSNIPDLSSIVYLTLVYLNCSKCFLIYRQVLLTLLANKSLKLPPTLNCISKRASDLTSSSNFLVLLSSLPTCVRDLKSLSVNRNRFRAHRTHGYNEYKHICHFNLPGWFLTLILLNL